MMITLLYEFVTNNTYNSIKYGVYNKGNNPVECAAPVRRPPSRATRGKNYIITTHNRR